MSKTNITRESEYLRALERAVHTEIGFSEADGKGLKSVSKFGQEMNILNQARNREIPSPSQTIITTASNEMHWDSKRLVWVKPNNTSGSQFVAVGAFFSKITDSTATYLINSATAVGNMVNVGTSAVVENISNAALSTSSQASKDYSIISGKINGAYSSVASFGSNIWKSTSDNVVSAYIHVADTAMHAINSVNKAAKAVSTIPRSIYSGIANFGVVSYKATLYAAANVYSYAVSSSSAAWKYVSGSASSEYKNASASVQNASDKAKMDKSNRILS